MVVLDQPAAVEDARKGHRAEHQEVQDRNPRERGQRARVVPVRDKNRGWVDNGPTSTPVEAMGPVSSVDCTMALEERKD